MLVDPHIFKGQCNIETGLNFYRGLPYRGYPDPPIPTRAQRRHADRAIKLRGEREGEEIGESRHERGERVARCKRDLKMEHRMLIPYTYLH